MQRLANYKIGMNTRREWESVTLILRVNGEKPYVVTGYENEREVGRLQRGELNSNGWTRKQSIVKMTAGMQRVDVG